MFDSFFFLSFWTLFTIVNPMGALGPFLSMTDRYSETRRKNVAIRASLISGSVLVVCLLVGNFFFRSLGLTIPALRIAGGILLLLVAIDMLNVRRSRFKGTAEEDLEAAQKEDVAVFPIAVPLLSGPGAIATVLMLADKVESFVQTAAIVGAIVLTAGIAMAILTQAALVQKIVGNIGLNIMTRLMGLVLASTAVQFILDGIRVALPGLTNGLHP